MRSLGLGLGMGATGSPFALARLSGCVLWLRADLGITLSGSNVSGWADQSGNGNNASQGTSANQPSYNVADSQYGGRPTVQFSGSQFMSLASHFPAQPFTVYIVGQSTSGTGQQEMFADSGHNVSLLIATGGSTSWSMYAGTALVSSGNTRQNVAQAFAMVFNGASSKLYVNSSSSGFSGSPGTSNPSGTETIGASTNGSGNRLIGKIAELAVFNQAHSQADVNFAFSSLASDYGGAWS